MGDAHIRNYFSSDEDAQVSLHLAIDDRTALVTRRRSTLVVIDGGIEYTDNSAVDWIAQQFKPTVAPESWSLADAERRFLSAHLLGQEEVAHFLRSTNPRDRFDALASLLGVDLVQRFFAHTTSVDKTAQAELRELETRAQSISQRMEQIRVEQSRMEAGAIEGASPTAERMLFALQDLAARATGLGLPAFVPTPRDVIVADIVSAGQELRALTTSFAEATRKRVHDLQQVEAELPQVAPRSSRVAALREELNQERRSSEAARSMVSAKSEELDNNRRRLAEIRAGIEAAKATVDQFAAFLLEAEAFVTSDHCPVCELPITPEDVRGRLRERIEHVPESLRVLEQQRQELEALDRGLHEQLVQPREALAAIRAQISALEDEERRLRETDVDWRPALAAVGLGEDPTLQDVAVERHRSTSQLSAVERLITEIDALLSQALYLVSQDRRSHLAEEETRLRAEHSSLTGAVEGARTSRALLQAITSAAKESELEIVKRLMLQQTPLLNALYQRLRPHPVLDQLEISFGQFGQRGEAYFEAATGDKRANVSAIFSSAQLNAVAICIFLALNVSAEGTRFALLDDPIQNMDDFNVLGLLDLLRSVSGNRQVILSTHDDQLGELMRRKLRPLQLTHRTIVHTFTGYDERGPQVETQVDEFSQAPEILPALVA